jgi:hypothetical protein
MLNSVLLNPYQNSNESVSFKFLSLEKRHLKFTFTSKDKIYIRICRSVSRNKKFFNYQKTSYKTSHFEIIRCRNRGDVPDIGQVKQNNY